MVRKYIAFLSLLGACVFCFGTAHAEDTYQTEFFVAYNQSKSDGGSKSKFQRLTVIRNFSSVNTTGHPFSEAAFLERIGNFRLFLGMDEAKRGPVLEGFGPFYGAFVNLRKPEWPITMQMGISKIIFEFDSPANAHDDLKAINVGIGVFFINTLHLGMEYRRTDTVRKEVTFSGSQKFSFETARYRIVSKFVLELENGQAINIVGDISRTRFDFPNSEGKNKAMNISGDYYFTPQLSLGGGFGKLETGKSYTARVRFFTNSSLSVGLEFSKFLADKSENNDSRSPNLFVAARF